MKRIVYLLIFIAFLLGVWLLRYSGFGGNAGSEIRRMKSSVFSEVTLIRNPNIEDIFLYLVFPSGEASNNFDEGLAHYVEHLAWLSAFGSDQNERMRHSNAWTNHFSTGYWHKTVDDDLHRALRALMGVATPLSVEDDFALEERDIVLREYDYRVAERPLYSVFRDMDQTLYGDGALARSVIGEPEVISDYSLGDAVSLHKQSHALSDATLLVYGGVSAARLEAILASLLVEDVHTLSASPRSIRLVEDGIVQKRTSASLAELSEDTFLYRKLVSIDVCETSAGCAVLAQLAENALGSSLPGGLAGPLRYDQFVTRSFSLDIAVIGEKYVELSFIGHPDTNISLDGLENVFRAALHGTLENGLPQETFDRVVSRFIGQFDSVLDRDRPGYNRDLMLDQLMSATPVFTLEDQINAVEDVRLEDVNEFLKSLLADGREVTRLVSAER
jgi:predicted Zn-dependent peptidase